MLTFVYGCGAAFFLPASTGLILQVVSPSRLQQANALLSLTASASGVLGPAMAGVLIAVANPHRDRGRQRDVPRPPPSSLGLSLPVAVARASMGFLTELREGWREFRSRTWLWVDGVYAALGNALVLFLVGASGPVVAERELNGSSSWAAIATGFGIGSVVGGVLAIRLRPRWPLRVAVSAFLTLSFPQPSWRSRRPPVQSRWPAARQVWA